MWISLALKAVKTFLGDQLNVLSYILIGFLVICLGWAGSLKIESYSLKSTISTQGETIAKNNSEIRELQTTVASKKSEINLQNKIIEQNRIDKEKNDQKAEVKKAEVKKEFKAKRDEVDTFKGEANATSCDNARMFFNSVYW